MIDNSLISIFDTDTEPNTIVAVEMQDESGAWVQLDRMRGGRRPADLYAALRIGPTERARIVAFGEDEQEVHRIARAFTHNDENYEIARFAREGAEQSEEPPAITEDWQGWIEAFRIFERYRDRPASRVLGEHDCVFAGPQASEITAEDQVRLKELGWHISPDTKSFARYT